MRDIFDVAFVYPRAWRVLSEVAGVMMRQPHSRWVHASLLRIFAVGLLAAGAACGESRSGPALDSAAPVPNDSVGGAGRGNPSAAVNAGATSSEPRLPYASWPDPLEFMPHGPAHTAEVCARGGNDPVRDVFCGEAVPTFTELRQLLTAFALDSDHVREFKGLLIANGPITAISMTGHSTALAARSVSAINPRLIVLQMKPVPFDLVALAFARGEQFTELTVRDRDDGQLRFYMIAYRQACNAAADGCTVADLLTPATEYDWTETTLYDERDLSNTGLDCAPCHQPDGPNTPKLLRMQELDGPWTHWFWNNSEGGRALLADYIAAKGDESLAGMTSAQINATDPNAIATLTILATPTQPNKFESAPIESEVQASAAALGGRQPADNSVPGDSATWRAIYEHAQRGEAITVPYHDVKVTDPEKLARATAAYQAYRAGQLPAAELPDIRDVFPDDPRKLAELGVMTEPGLDGGAVLLQSCSQCHNGRLDQTLTRARFRADLQGVSREEKDIAIERLQLPATDLRAMPPARLRALSPEARQRAIDWLRR